MLLHVLLLSVGFLFVLDFPLRKPSLKTLMVMIITVSITVGIIFGFTKFKVPAHTDESNQIVEEIIEELYETENP